MATASDIEIEIQRKAEIQELGDRTSLWRFATKASSGTWKPHNHLRYVADILAREIPKGGARIIINLPPRHGKSLLVSHWLPVWYLGWYPERHVILTSYGDALASDWGRRARDEYRHNPLVWASVSRTKDAASDWRTTEGGGMRTAGVRGPIVGFGGNLIIIDDPTKNREESLSPTQRARLNEWFDATLYTRCEPGASIVLIMQRWHEQDLTGYLLGDHKDKWTHIKLPAIAEEKDPLKRIVGQPLSPDVYGVTQLRQIRDAVGGVVWAGMYQQRPAPQSGNIIKREWIKRYENAPEHFDTIAQSWDLTFKGSGTSYAVGQVWGLAGADYYLLDQVRGKWDFPETVRQVRLLSDKWPAATAKFVEDAANGPALIATLKDEIRGILPIRAKGSKETRLLAVSPFFESGHVFVSRHEPWGYDFIEEIVAFPYADDDDQVDAATMALYQLHTNYVPRNLVLPRGGVRQSPWVM